MTEALDYRRLVEEAQAQPPAAALVLGSGMSGLADRLRSIVRVPFGDVPGYSASSVIGHRGCLTLGEWAGKRTLVFEGRLHYYEGHPWRSVTHSIHVAHYLGARVVLLTNAAGGIGAAQEPGSLMAIRDHMEWTWPYFWQRPGPGSPVGSRPSPYSPRLIPILQAAAQELGSALPTGIYAAMTGPCYETPAEIRALARLGADAVGMSTAREVQAGHELAMECAAVSCITNRAAGLSATPLNHEEVLIMARAQGQRLADLIEGFLRRL